MSDNALKQESMASRVIAFLSNELAVPPEKIGMLTRLRQDLKINGVDAANLIEAFALTFDVDNDTFRVNDYFTPDEGINPLMARIFWIFGNGRPLKTLTVKDLILAAEKGALR